MGNAAPDGRTTRIAGARDMRCAYTKSSISMTAGLLIAGLTATAALASSESAADALADKFIDGPGRQTASDQRRRELEAQRRRELDELSEKLSRARAAARAAKRRQQDLSIRIGPPPRRTDELRTFERQRRSIRERRVAVLMVLRPNAKRRRPSRRFDRTADPVLCLGSRCYISAGAERDAREMSRRQALGPGNSLGRRAGACRRSPRCVFRNVDLRTAAAEAQAIDLGWLRHDRRRPVILEADPTCRMIKRRLSCGLAIEAQDYRLWVVPESLARQIGPRALEDALAAGLRPSDRHAAAVGGDRATRY